eukprot:g16297.t1
MLTFVVQLALVQATAAAIAGSASAVRPQTRPVTDRVPRVSVAWLREKLSAVDPHARRFCFFPADAAQLSTEELRDIIIAFAEMTHAENSAWRATEDRLSYLRRGLLRFEGNNRRDRVETGRLCRSTGRRAAPAEYHNLEHEEGERLEAADEQADQSCVTGSGRTTPDASGYPVVRSIRESLQEIRRLHDMSREAQEGRERWAELHKMSLGLLMERPAGK